MKLTKSRLAMGILALVLLLPGLAVAVSPFVDVATGAFYEAPVNWAFSNQITTGVDATHFNPNGQVTRGESVTFLKRYHDNIVQPAVDNIGESLGQLTCATNQVARYNGTSWICNTIGLTYQARPGPKVTLDAIGNVGQYTSIAIGTDTFPIISYWDATNFNLKVMHCTDPVCNNSGTQATLDATGNVGEYTSIAIGTDTFPIISYYDVTNQNLKVVHCTDQACNNTDTPVTLDNTGNVGFDLSIAIGTDTFPIISYYDVTNQDLKVVHCTDQACSNTDTPVTLDATGTVGQYTSIAIGTDTFPIISYYDTTASNLKVVHCGDQACNNAVTPVTLDNTGNVGFFTSITIGTDNLPIVSYYDVTNQDLKVVHCTDQACSNTDTPVTLDATGNVGQYTSIAIGADTFPTISYYDTTASSLKVVHCGNQACDNAVTPDTLDATGNVGQYASIAIGADTFPMVSYWDGTNQDLKVVRFDIVVTGIAFS